MWVGVDFDGTLMTHPPRGHTEWLRIDGKPIQPMVDRLIGHVKRGDEVRIFTARANYPEQVSLIQDWLEKHGMPRLAVTATKDIDMMLYYDDLAISVERDTGRLVCPSCEWP